MKEKFKSLPGLSKFVLIFLTFPCAFRILLYIYVAVRGLGTFAVGRYFGLFINCLMYYSIFQYAIDVFVKGKTDASLSSLIFRYGVSSLSSLIGLQNTNSTVFLLTAIMVFLVPYVSGTLRKKTSLILVIVILVLAFTLSVLYIQNPSADYCQELGTVIYNLDALNPAIEWGLFTVLYFARALPLLKEAEEK